MAKKLVRDFVPEIMKESNKNINFYQIKKEDHLKFLKAKLLEESKEFIGSDSYEELVDILEVIDAISNSMNIDFEELLKMKKYKKQTRGGYDNGIIVISYSNF